MIQDTKTTAPRAIRWSERYSGGSAEAELAEFQQLAQAIMAVQTTVRKKVSSHGVPHPIQRATPTGRRVRGASPRPSHARGRESCELSTERTALFESAGAAIVALLAKAAALHSGLCSSGGARWHSTSHLR
jgi:hypothetical protein